MRLVVQEDAESVGEWVAHYVQERIRRFKPTAERPFVLGLPTGSSPLPTYRKLVELHKSGQLSFEHVVTVNMDEYVGLSPTHEQSYHAFMWTNLFEHIDIRPENVHILDGMAEDLQAECDKYEAMIEDLGGIELFLGGIGPDGHIAFNEPGSSLCSRTRVKTLAYDTIVANSRFFGGDIAKVPTMALTVGVGTVMDAREVLVIITGVSKALALHKCIEEGVSHMWTVSCLQQHPRACIACDEDATLECKVKTIRYFKGLQDTQLKLLQLPMEGYGGTSLTRGSSTGSAAAAPAPLSSTARMAVQEARKDRLSASSVMAAMSRAAERLSDDRSVSSVDGANAFRELATVAARGKPAAAAAAASAGASSGRAPKRGADDASRSAAKRARDV